MNICEQGPPQIAERMAVVYGIVKTVFFPQFEIE